MLWMKLIPHTVFHNLQEVLLDYRWHGSNTSIVRKRELDAQDLRCKAWAKLNLPELYAEYGLRCETVRRIRLFGVPILKLRSSFRETEVRLPGGIPFVRISRRFGL